MNPTRRDVLAAVLALPGAVAVPTPADETPDSETTPSPTHESIAYLSGYTMMKDVTDGDRYVGGDFEMYVDDRKAIFHVAIYEDNRCVAWKEYVFVQTAQIAMMRTMCAMLKEGSL